MKMKWIMLVTLLLLAVLTIGAASAVEDNNVTSDDLQVSDEGDDVVELNGYDDEKHYIEVNNDKIDLTDNEDTVADIYLPTGAKGRFCVFNGEDEVVKLEVDPNDDDHWDDDGELWGTLYVGDIDFTEIHNDDTLLFKFFELKGSQYVLDERFTVTCKVSLKDSVMQFKNITGGTSENDGEIEVNSIDLNKTDENFTYVYVAEKDGIFRITIDPDDDEIIIFEENLKNSGRKYVQIRDEYDDLYYKFGFSLTDINNFIAQNVGGVDSFNDLIDKNYLSNGSEIYFELVEDDEDETEMDSITMIATIKDGKILLVEDEEYVNVEYGDELGISMDGAWNETEIITYEVKNGIKGKIVIRLNDNQTPAFEKALSELVPDDESDEDFNYYTFTIADLNITQAGEYVLNCYFYDENGELLYPYDDEEPETLILRSSQIVTGDNISIILSKLPIRVDEDKTVITINATDGHADDEVIIYVDENVDPITIRFENCTNEEDGIYVITSKQLKLGVGIHTLNITCKGLNLIDDVNITTDLRIHLVEEIVYTTFNDAFVLIDLEEDDITVAKDITGLVNVTITDSEGKVVATVHRDIEDDIGIDFEENSFVICTSDVDAELNGTYAVSVIYYNGNKGFVESEGNVTFKDYRINISDAIVDDNIITFDDVPFDYDILVSIDGNEPILFNESSLIKEPGSEGKSIYVIKQDQLGLTDGPHSISVSIDSDKGIINLANVNVLVDLKENVDPELNIAVADIEAGNNATVFITTNATFSGKVAVKVGNRNYTVDVANGQGNVTVPGLEVGTYTATAIFAADAFFNASTKNTTFKVTAKPAPGQMNGTVDPALTIAVADIEVGNVATVLITTNSTFTGVVLVQVADKNYTVNVENGKGNVSVTGLAANTYTATAFFKQTELFNASTKTATFKVTAKQTASANKKEVVKVTLKKVKVKKSAKKLVLKATVKVNGKAKKGLKVTFKIKGKKVGTKKTNKKGVAKLTLKKKALKKALKKAKVGKKIKIQATCKGTTKTIKVKVKK